MTDLISTMCTAALELYEAGYSVFPLMPRDKIPYGTLLPLGPDGKSTWTPFQTTRATPDQIRSWWGVAPDANIAIATGPVSGMFVTDVDGEEAAKVLNAHGKMPITRVGKTGRGWHIHLRYPDFPVRNRTDILPDVDIRGDGGYIVAPPSIHPSGKPYVWARSYKTTDIAIAPAWWLELLKPVEHKPIARVNYPPADASEQWDKAQAALDQLHGWRCDDRTCWISIGMALKESLGDRAYSLWENWSARSSKFDAQTCERQWESLHRENGNIITIGTLFKWAIEDSGTGWLERFKKSDRIDVSTFQRNCPGPEKTTWQTLPDSVRSAVLNYAPVAVAPVIEVWVEAIGKGKLAPNEAVDANRLIELSVELKRRICAHTIRAGLSRMAGYFSENAPVLYSTNTEDSTSIDSRIKHSVRAGRKSLRYILKSIDAILSALAKMAIAPILERAFPPGNDALAPAHATFLESLGLDADEAQRTAADLDQRYGSLIAAQPGYRTAIRQARSEYGRLIRSLRNLTSTPIPTDLDICNGTEYRAAYARSIVLASPDGTQIPRSRWRAILGVSDKALPGVWKRAGLVIEKDVMIARSIISADAIRKVTLEYDAEYQGRPETLISTLDKKPLKFEPDELVYRWVQGQLEAGASVTLVYHQANRQRIKRIIYAAIAAVERLIGWVLDKLKPSAKQLSFIDEPEPEAILEPSEPEVEPIDERFTAQPKAPKSPDDPTLTYSEGWLKTLFSRATTFDLVGPEAVDLTSGEIVPYSTQLALDLLLQPTGTSP